MAPPPLPGPPMCLRTCHQSVYIQCCCSAFGRATNSPGRASQPAYNQSIRLSVSLRRVDAHRAEIRCGQNGIRPNNSPPVPFTKPFVCPPTLPATHLEAGGIQHAVARLAERLRWVGTARAVPTLDFGRGGRRCSAPLSTADKCCLAPPSVHETDAKHFAAVPRAPWWHWTCGLYLKQHTLGTRMNPVVILGLVVVDARQVVRLWPRLGICIGTRNNQLRAGPVTRIQLTGRR
jgi:hypothetical protein